MQLLSVIFAIWQVSKSNCHDILNFNSTHLILTNLIQQVIDRYSIDSLNLSTNCNYDVLLLLNELKEQKLWALKMFDASPKIQSGILDGNVHDLGTFDECIAINENIQSKNLLGQYCLVDVKANTDIIKKVQNSIPLLQKITRSICLPNSCTNTDIEKMFKSINITASILPGSCQTQKFASDIDLLSLCIIIFFGFIFLLLVISTAYDFIVENIYKTTASTVLSAFSILKNGKKIFTVTNSGNEISCMYGIRVISMAWIVIGHQYLLMIKFPVLNSVSAFTSLMNHEYDFLVGAGKSVDTFLLLSGISLCYVFLLTTKDYKFNLPVFYLLRYLRLTPALGAVVLIHIALLKYFGRGPYMSQISTYQSKICLEQWWKTIFYINNYEINRCLTHSWYLSVDTQLYIISPIILIILQKRPKMGLFLIGFLVASVITACFAISWINKLPTNGVYIKDNSEFLKKFYLTVYTRAGPWLTGIAVGYIIYTTKQKNRKVLLNSIIVTFLWVISITVLSLLTLYDYNSFEDVTNTRLRNSIKNAFSRTLWSFAIGWIIFACSFGYGGVINYFLSLPIFQVVSKLTYSVYLIHITILYVFIGRLRTALYLDHSIMFIQFWGIYIYTCLASLVLSLAFESPIITIAKVIFGKKSKKQIIAKKPVY